MLEAHFNTKLCRDPFTNFGCRKCRPTNVISPLCFHFMRAMPKTH